MKPPNEKRSELTDLNNSIDTMLDEVTELENNWRAISLDQPAHSVIDVEMRPFVSD